MRPGRLLAAATLLASVFVGCAAVPEIRFVDDDAAAGDGGLKDGNPAGDSAADAKTDGAKDGAAGMCTGAAPEVGATCCGAVWCVGDCSPANCTDCAQKGCGVGETCCGKTGTVQCKARCP